MKQTLRLVRVALLLTCVNSFARGDLLVNITDAGSGDTLWTFSGSAIANRSGKFTGDTFVFNDEYWHGLGLFWSNGIVSDTTLTGVANLSAAGDLRNIDSIVSRNDINTSLGIGVSGGDLRFASGDLVSWSGSVTADLNFSVYNTGTYLTSNYGGLADTLDLRVVVGPITAVPEPSHFAVLTLLVCGALLGPTYTKRRVKENQSRGHG